jgi:hypothetical protein
MFEYKQLHWATAETELSLGFILQVGVLDPWSFDTASETDPRIYWIKDPDSDRDLFFSGSQDTNKNLFYFLFFLLLTIIRLERYQVIKKSQNNKNKVLYFFCFLMDGSGRIRFGIRRYNYGSRSGSPKNLQTLRIRIRNTDSTIQWRRIRLFLLHYLLSWLKINT